MLFMLVNRTRPGLAANEYAELGRLAQGFYDNTPAGVRLLGDWAAIDRSRTFSLLETEDPLLLEAIQGPFRGLVDIEAVPATRVSGWGKG